MHANTIKLTVMELMITLPASHKEYCGKTNPRGIFSSFVLALVAANRSNRFATLFIARSDSRSRSDSSWKRRKMHPPLSRRLWLVQLLPKEKRTHGLLDQSPIYSLARLS